MTCIRKLLVKTCSCESNWTGHFHHEVLSYQCTFSRQSIWRQDGLKSL